MEFASQLAGRGSNLVLVARRADRLESLAEKLRSEYGISVTTVAIDLSQPAPGEILLSQLVDREITVTSVINNAGFGMWGKFLESDPNRLRTMMALNVTAVMDISRAFLPLLQLRGGGYLINITSLAAYSSIPMQGAYSATKAFVLSFTEALWAETRGSGVRVLAFAPGVTTTEFFDVLQVDDSAASAGRAQSPKQVVDTALSILDRRDPPPSWVSGHLNHLIAVLPRYLTRRRAVLLTGRTTMRNITTAQSEAIPARSEKIRQALGLDLTSSGRQHVIDITTTGAKSGRPRRIEIWFHHYDGRWFLSGTPGPKSWYANLLKNPDFTFHLKHGIHADLPATARPIVEAEERRAIFARMVEVYNLPKNPARVPQPVRVEDLLTGSPLVEISFASI
ncbi:MAG: oxidoreductase [Subtercola sp.]|nr:oxidoreductase [Subtercola sp.]